MSGLPPRPGPSAFEVAVVTAAVRLSVSGIPDAAPVDATPAWRFSGRWYARGPLADRRPTVTR